VTPPVLVKRVDPAYSEEARAAKYTGSVLLSVVVDEHGSVRSASVIKSLGMGLDEKAEEAVLKWTFKPGTKDGKPVSVSVQVEVN
jgi:TonB family protein